MDSILTTIPGADQKQPLRRIKLLVVGEDLELLTSRRAFLERLGYQVLVCSSHEQAVSCLQSEVWNFVLLSQESPQLDWRSVLQRAIAIDRRTPVLVLTRCVDMRSYLDAIQLGAVDYVAEPLTASEVARLIEGHLRPQVPSSRVRQGLD